MAPRSLEIPNLKRKLLFCLLCVAPAMTLASEASDGEDFAIYLQSTAGPVAVEKCAGVLPEANSVKLAFDGWMAKYKARVAHGRQLALTRRSEQEVRTWEAANAQDYRTRVDGMDAAGKQQWCSGVLRIFQGQPAN